MLPDDEYVCTLDQASIQVARDELNEDPKERLGQVETFRKWIKDQKHLKCPTDAVYLLRFLRTAKFSQLRAREVLEGHLQSKADSPEWMNECDTRDPDLVKIFKTGYITPLPKKDAKGRQFILVRIGAFEPDPKLWDKNKLVKAIFGLFYYLLLDENTLVNGFVFLTDFTHFTPKFLTFFGLETVRKTSKLWQGKFPGRFKTFHYFNPGNFMEVFLGIFKPLLSKKFQDRIHIHGKNLEDLYKSIPMEYLPEDYLPDDYTGPSQGSVETIIDNLVAELHKDKTRNVLRHLTNKAWTYDHTLKAQDIPSESFRKLNID